MSAASPSPNPSNLILLAVLGIGAYWFLTQRAQAGAVRATVPSNGQGGIMPSSGFPTASVLQWAANDKSLWAGVTKLLGGGATPAQTAGYYAANNSYNNQGPVTPMSPSDDNSVFPDWVPSNPSPSGWGWGDVPYGSM